MKGKELKSEKVIIEAKGKEYELALDMNALCELEEIYGDIKLAINTFKDKPIKTVRNFIYAMLKSQDEKLTISKAGAMIDTKNFNQVVEAITKLIEEAFPTTDTEVDDIEDTEVEGDLERKND